MLIIWKFLKSIVGQMRPAVFKALGLHIEKILLIALHMPVCKYLVWFSNTMWIGGFN